MNQKLSIRHPKMEDAKSICSLVIACDVYDFGEPDFDLGALHEMWAGFDMQNNVWVVENEENVIVGYGYLEEDSDVKMSSAGFVLPSARGSGVGKLLLETMVQRAQSISSRSGWEKRLQNVIPTLRDDAQKLLNTFGFEPIRYFNRMRIKLETEPIYPKVPDGLFIDTFVKGQDEQLVYNAYVESFADHWDFAVPTFESWVEKTKRPSFNPEWWFVARNKNGDVAGIALCTMHEDMLFVNQLGVKSAYRGIGLGFALLQKTFHAAYHSGQPVVSLGVDSKSPTGANRLYEKAGMQAIQDLTFCEKRIIPVG